MKLPSDFDLNDDVVQILELNFKNNYDTLIPHTHCFTVLDMIKKHLLMKKSEESHFLFREKM